MKGKLEPFRPWRPVVFAEGPNPAPGTVNKADIVALKAAWQGEATPDQQRRALETILYRVAEVNEPTFRADDHGGSRETDFACGKQHVGMQIRKLIEVPMNLLTGEKERSSG